MTLQNFVATFKKKNENQVNNFVYRNPILKQYKINVNKDEFIQIDAMQCGIYIHGTTTTIVCSSDCYEVLLILLQQFFKEIMKII